MVNNMLKKNLFNFFLILVIFFIDRLSKFLIIQSSNPYGEINIGVTSFLNLNLIWNDGIAFGLFSFDQNLYYNMLTIFICLIILIIVFVNIYLILTK